MKDGSGNTAPVTANALHEAATLAQPDMNEDEIRDLLDVTEKGQVKSSITNAELILSYDPLLRGAIRFNELTQRVDVVKPMGWERGSNGPALTDNDIFNFHLYCDRTYGITSKALVEEAVSIVASGRAEGYNIRGADLGGGSVMAELGATIHPDRNSPWSLDLNLAGFAGKKQGISGGVSVSFMF